METGLAVVEKQIDQIKEKVNEFVAFSKSLIIKNPEEYKLVNRLENGNL